MTTGGSSAAGSNGSGGNAATGGSGNGGDGGSGGDAGDAGATSTGGQGGATGGTSAGGTSPGGEGGGGSCVDVCALHGAACCIPNVECVSAETSCTVEVLAGIVITFGDYAMFEQSVEALPQDLLVSFTDADIARAAADPAPAARIELHMTAEFDALHGEALSRAYNHPFRVSCNGQRLFVGIIYMVEGAAALNFPVLHVARENDELVLRLGARLGAWPGTIGTVDAEARQRIDRAELRGALCLRGELGELDPP